MAEAKQDEKREISNPSSQTIPASDKDKSE
jgi:hypothetical protein